MEKSKSKQKQRAEKAPLNVTGQPAMPKEILPWERDLLAILIELYGFILSHALDQHPPRWPSVPLALPRVFEPSSLRRGAPSPRSSERHRGASCRTA